MRAKLTTENVAKLVPNPEPKRREGATFGSWEELEKVAEELAPERRSLPILVAGTGLRPEEWLALERRDLDTKAGVLHVRRVFTDGRVKEYGKRTAPCGACRCAGGRWTPSQRIPGVSTRPSPIRATGAAT